MVENSIGPHDMPVYGWDGYISNALAENFAEGK